MLIQHATAVMTHVQPYTINASSFRAIAQLGQGLTDLCPHKRLLSLTCHKRLISLTCQCDSVYQQEDSLATLLEVHPPCAISPQLGQMLIEPCPHKRLLSECQSITSKI